MGIDYQEIAGWLYSILDDIDSASDMAKGNDVLYRKTVERLQELKNKVAYSLDGQTLVYQEPCEEYGLTRLF